MFEVIESPAKREIRSVIRFLTARNKSAADIHSQITGVYGTEAMSDRKVRKWEIHDNPLSLDFPDVSRSVVHKIVTEDLSFKKLCSWWVPRLGTQREEVCQFTGLFDLLRGRKR
ncbi:HTH_48 domain-containing protein [Trichonephila clavipes]|nr:HTH_48 domain-containing protein [Trichonephila clavipes]